MKKRAAKKRAPSELRPGEVLVLRTCDANMRAHGGFRWPTKGVVKAPDWEATRECGSGLHGLLWGKGDGSLVSFAPDARWLVVAVKEATIVDLADKVKFPTGRVLHAGDRLSATTYLADRSPDPSGIVGGTATAGHRGTATAGYMGTICVRWWDAKSGRCRVAVAYVGEDGVEPGVAYTLRDGKFGEAVKP